MKRGVGWVEGGAFFSFWFNLVFKWERALSMVKHYQKGTSRVREVESTQKKLLNERSMASVTKEVLNKYLLNK